MRLAVLCPALLLILATQAIAQPCTYTVNDGGDGPIAASGFLGGVGSSGVCVTESGTCTLRAAMQLADGASGCMGVTKHILVGVDTITLSGPVGVTGATGPFAINGNSLETFYNSDYLIEPEPPLTRFTVESQRTDQPAFVQYNHEAWIRNMTLRNFRTSGTGAAIALVGPSGTMTCEGCIFENNRSTNNGGAVFMDALAGLLLIENLFLGNRSVAGSGGAIFQKDQSSLYVIRSVFEGNEAEATGGAISQLASGPASPVLYMFGTSFVSNRAKRAGGAIYYHSTSGGGFSQLTIAQNTVEGPPVSLPNGFTGPTGPTSPLGPTGGGVYNAYPTGGFNITGSILANNHVIVSGGATTDNDCATNDLAAVSGGNNIVAAPGSCFPGDPSLIQADPRFQPYDPVAHRLGLFAGPAVDAGSATCADSMTPFALGRSLPTATTVSLYDPDWSGTTRPIAAACDLGAFEYRGTNLGVTLTGPTGWQVGEPLSLQLSLGNTGLEPAHPGTLVLSALDGTITSVGASGCTGVGTPTVTCPTQTMSTGQTVSFALVASTTSVQPVVFSAALQSYSDTDASNNSASITRTPQASSFICDHIVDTISGETDDEFRVRLRVVNDSGRDASTSSVSLEWSQTLTFVGGDARCTLDATNRRLTCEGGPLANGQANVFAVTVQPSGIGEAAITERCSLSLGSALVTETSRFAIEVITPATGSGEGGAADGEDVSRLGDLDLKTARGRGGGGLRCGAAHDDSFGLTLAALWLLRRLSKKRVRDWTCGR